MRSAAGLLLLMSFLGLPILAHGGSSICDPKREKNCQGSADACLSEKISFKDGRIVFATSKPQAYDQCVEKQCIYAKEKAQQCRCGRETFDTAPGKMSKLDISRCNPNLSKIVSTVVGSGASDASNLFSQQDVVKIVAQSIPLNDTATLSAVLQGVGIDGATEDVVKSNPQAAYDLLQGIANGDQSATQEAAGKLGLNADLSDAKTLQGKLGQALQDNVPDQWSRTASTFNPPETSSLTLDARGSPTAPVLPGNKIDPGVLGAIAADAQRKVCAVVPGTCYVSTDAQFATMMKETNGNVRLYGDGGQSASLAQVYASQPGFAKYLATYQTVYSEPYMLHQTNIQDPSLNPEWIASQSVRMQAIVLQDKGERTGGDFGRILAGYNGGGYAAAVYGSQAMSNAFTLQAGNATPYWQAAYNAANQAVATGPDIENLTHNIPTGGPGYSPSPFANVNPVNSWFPNDNAYPVSTGRPTSIGYPAGNTLPAAQSSLYTPAFSGISGTPASIPIVPVQPVATIIVQPKSVTRGNPLTVSWSSVGMSATALCQVAQDATVVGQGNGGSKIVPTGPATPTGTTTFTLTCTAQSGEHIQQSASASIN